MPKKAKPAPTPPRFKQTIRTSDGTTFNVYEAGFTRMRPAPEHGKEYPEYEAFDQLAPGDYLLRPASDEYTKRDAQTFWAPKFRDRIHKRHPKAKTHAFFNYGPEGGLWFTFELLGMPESAPDK